MHFTLWPSLRATTGGYCALPSDQLREFFASPAVSATKEALEGWSPARFRDELRGLQNVEAVSALVLDVDSGDHPIERLRDVFGVVAGFVHSSWSHAPPVRKWRVVSLLSRDVTVEEHGRLWDAAESRARRCGIALDRATRDASRFWFVPGRRAADAPYEWCEIPGEPLDVDYQLATFTRDAGTVTPPKIVGKVQSTPAGHPAALALGRAWPASGRHEAQLALAGALRAEGWPAERALDFLCAVCAVAGDEDRPKREATIRHTYQRAPDAPTTGWTRLAALVPAIIVDAVRAKVGRDAGFAEVVSAKLEAAKASPTLAQVASVTTDPNAVKVTLDAELAEPMPPLSYLLREIGLVSGGGAPHLVAGYGFSGKTLALQSMLLSLAAGVPVWGAFPVARPLRVLHVDLEQGDLTKRRFQRLAVGMGVDLRALGGRLGAAIMPRIKLAAGEARWIDLMLGRDLVVVDSLRAACGGSENDSEFRGALDMLGEVSHATGCRALVIHHAKKPGEDDSEARYSIRGSSAIYDAVDSAYVFGAAKGEPIKVEHVKARSHGDLECDRALVVSDVAVGGDPKGGLRVSTVSLENVAEARAAREQEDRRAKAVADGAILRRVLTAQPGLNAGELQAAVKLEMGWGKDRVMASVMALGEEVKTDVVIVNRGRSTRYFLK
jgi:hypothetical protein